MQGTTPTRLTDAVRNRDPRFRQNLQLARDGGDAGDVAKDILWKEFGVDFDKEGGRYAE